MLHQNLDGSWYYSFDPDTGKPKKQIDFHQGYVLETIKRICDFANIDISIYDKEIRLGLEFYRKINLMTMEFLFGDYKKWPVIYIIKVRE